MKHARNSNPERATTPFCLVRSSFARILFSRVDGAQKKKTMPMMSIGMKSRAISRHAPRKANVPAGAKSRVAIAANPINSLLSELNRSLIRLSFDKTNVAIKS
jgi:hypothetical protein